MDTQRIPNNVNIEGNLVVQGSLPTIERTSLDIDYLQPHAIKVNEFRKTTAFDTVMPGTSSGTDLGLYTGTHGAASPTLACPYIATSDLKTLGATTRTARALFCLPAE